MSIKYTYMETNTTMNTERKLQKQSTRQVTKGQTNNEITGYEILHFFFYFSYN